MNGARAKAARFASGGLTHFRSVLAALLFCLCVAPVVLRGDDQPTAKQPTTKPPSSLDQQLLDDLGGDLLEGLDLPPIGKQSKTKPSETKPAAPPTSPETKPGETPTTEPGKTSETDQLLLDQLIDGEDVDLSGKGGDPILDLGRRMKAVERMIGERNTSAGTQQMQEQIVADIARLIEQLRQQRQQQSKSGSKSSSSKPSPGGQKEPGDQESNKPAEDSQERTGKNTDPTYEVGAMQDLLKDVWGHLPEQVRRQMLSGSGEEVLPKYQKLIEEYYKRLAEDAAKYP